MLSDYFYLKIYFEKTCLNKQTYLFTVMSNNSPHKLISLVKLIFNFKESKSERKAKNKNFQRIKFNIV